MFQWQHIPRPHKEVQRSPTPPIHDLQSSMPLLDYYLELRQQSRESEVDTPDRDTPQRSPSSLPSPRDLLGQGRVDPFVTFAVDEDYSPIHLGIDYGESGL
jgi:hypothetical protein